MSIRLLAIVVPILHLLVFHVALASQGLESVFLEEYKKKSEGFENPYLQGLRVRASCQSERADKFVEKEMFFMGDLLRSEIDMSSRFVVACRNSQWDFVIIRKAKLPFEILHLERTRKDFENEELSEAKFEFHPQYHVHGIPLIDVMSKPGFKIHKCSSTTVSGEELVHVEFERILGSRISQETLTLNRSRNWVITRHEMVLSNGQTYAYKVSYPREGVFPSELLITRDGKQHRKVLYKDWAMGPIATEPFYLSFYGLPEYEDFSWKWIAYGCIAIAVAVCWFWFLRKKFLKA